MSRLRSGPAWAMLKFGLSFARNVLLIPLLLHYWGAAAYASWLMAGAAVSLLLVIPDGFVRYATNRYNLAAATRPPKAATLLCHGGKMLSLMLLALLAASGIVLILFPELPALLSAGAPENQEQLHWALWIFLAGNATQLWARLAGAVQEPRDRYWVNLAFEVLLLTVETSAIVLLVSQGFGVSTTLAGSGIILILGSLAYAARLLRLYGAPLHWWTGQTGPGWRMFRRSASFHLLHGLERLMQESFLLVLVLYGYGAALLPVYATVRTLANAPLSALTLVSSSLMPQLQRFYARHDGGRLRALLQWLWHMPAAAVCTGMVLVFPFLEEIYTWWTRARLSWHPGFTALMLAWAMAQVYATPMSLMARSVNQAAAVLSLSLVRAALVLLALLVLPRSLESLGLVLAGTEWLMALGLYPYLTQKIWPRKAGIPANAWFGAGALPVLVPALTLCGWLLWPGWAWPAAAALMLVWTGMQSRACWAAIQEPFKTPVHDTA